MKEKKMLTEGRKEETKGHFLRFDQVKAGEKRVSAKFCGDKSGE